MNETPLPIPPSAIVHGWTPNELAKVLRVSPDKVRSWIKRGILSAIDTNDVQCGRPRYVILPHHLADFERRRHAAKTNPTAPIRGN